MLEAEKYGREEPLLAPALLLWDVEVDKEDATLEVPAGLKDAGVDNEDIRPVRMLIDAVLPSGEEAGVEDADTVLVCKEEELELAALEEETVDKGL